MEFSLEKSLEILEQTPKTLNILLGRLSSDWTMQNEGGETWTVFDVIGHLIHGESTDWIKRVEIILSDKTNKNFTPFDRFAQFSSSKNKSLEQLLNEFEAKRNENLELLRSWNITPNDFNKTGIHPTFGEVTLSQLLSTWTVHDLNHIAQITRIMAHQYKSAVGPWIEYLRILGN